MADGPGVVAPLDIAGFGLGSPSAYNLVGLATPLVSSLSDAHAAVSGNQALVANELTLDVNGILDGTQDEFVTAALPSGAAADNADVLAAQAGYAELRDQLRIFRSSLSADAFTDGTPDYTPPPVYGNPSGTDPDPGPLPI